MGFLRQEYWSELPFPSSGDPPNPGTKPWSPALQTDSLPSESLGKPYPGSIPRQGIKILLQVTTHCCLTKNNMAGNIPFLTSKLNLHLPYDPQQSICWVFALEKWNLQFSKKRHTLETIQMSIQWWMNELWYIHTVDYTSNKIKDLILT